MIKIKNLNRSRKTIRLIKPETSSKSNHLNDFNECLKQLDDITDENDKLVLIKLVVFIYSKNSRQFVEIQSSLTDELSVHYGLSLPIISYIAQPSGENFDLVIEATLFDNSESDFHIDFYHNPKSSYCVIADHNYEEIFGITADITPNENGIFAQSSNCFNEMEQILGDNGLTLADLDRQWTYIGKINEFNQLNGKKVENYQQFNIARANHYSNYEWKNGFPAATGIGANIPGCTMEFTASPSNDNTIIIPLHNPKQQDAHHYSEKYQIKEFTLFDNDNYENTPKFERGKIVINADAMDVYISGTAAILGEDSIERSISQQTKITLENISVLFSKENLLVHGLKIEDDLPKFDLLRVYIKNREDYIIVKDICREFYPDVPLLIVQADVCRKELLVEIEAYANSLVERI